MKAGELRHVNSARTVKSPTRYPSTSYSFGTSTEAYGILAPPLLPLHIPPNASHWERGRGGAVHWSAGSAGAASAGPARHQLAPWWEVRDAVPGNSYWLFFAGFLLVFVSSAFLLVSRVI